MPFVIGSALATTIVIGAGVVAAGASIVGGIQKHNDANRAAKAAEFNERETRIMTMINLQRQQRKAYQVLGAEEAAVAGSGFSMSGTALDLLHSSVANASLDANLIATRGELEAHGYAAQATADKSAATTALVEGGVGAVSSLAKAYGTFGGYA